MTATRTGFSGLAGAFETLPGASTSNFQKPAADAPNTLNRLRRGWSGAYPLIPRQPTVGARVEHSGQQSLLRQC